MGVSVSGGANLKQLQRSMIFIDGTNLFYRLTGAKLVVPSIRNLFQKFSFITDGCEIVRIYLYSIQQHVEAALQRHGAQSLDGIRVVFGDAIPTSGGNLKEKGVDALLVADLVYHAASRNCDYAVLVSSDTDFARAIKRVEDFGCRTAVVGICADVPDRLKQNCDRSYFVTADNILTSKLGQTV